MVIKHNVLEKSSRKHLRPIRGKNRRPLDYQSKVVLCLSVILRQTVKQIKKNPENTLNCWTLSTSVTYSQCSDSGKSSEEGTRYQSLCSLHAKTTSNALVPCTHLRTVLNLKNPSNETNFQILFFTKNTKYTFNFYAPTNHYKIPH